MNEVINDIWYVFPYRNDLEKIVIRNRLEQLGYFYNNSFRYAYNTFSIKKISKTIQYTSIEVTKKLQSGDYYPKHVLGSLKDLFFTEKYKFIGVNDVPDSYTY